MDVNPLTETTDFKAMRDNRDCGVLLSWDPPHRTFTQAMQDASFAEEVIIIIIIIMYVCL